MTGYGRGTANFDGRQIAVELSSVNRKQAEISLNLPRALLELEPRMRDEINAHISRGRLTVAVGLHAAPSARANGINLPAAKAYRKQLETLRTTLKLAGEITLDQVLRGPGVLDSENVEIPIEKAWPAVQKALQAALAQFVKMRQREGEALAADLRKRTLSLQRSVKTIGVLAPKVMEHHRGLLLERSAKAGLEIEPSDERLLKEIVFFADRHLRGTYPAPQPSRPVLRPPRQGRAGRPHARFPAPGTFPRDQHHRQQGQFPRHQPARRDHENGVGKIAGAGSEYRMNPPIFRRQGILFVISAPSGTGKTTLCENLRATPDFIYSVSCTTRAPRAGEVDGTDYHFLTREEFQDKIKRGEMLEHAVVHGHYYGTLKATVKEALTHGTDVLLDIDVQGAATIRATDDEMLRGSLVDVFIMPPTIEELEKRLRKRGTESEEQVMLRLQTGREESKLWLLYKYTILSGSMEEDLIKFRAIMRAERYLSRRLELQSS